MSVKHKENLLFLENSGAILHATNMKNKNIFEKESIIMKRKLIAGLLTALSMTVVCPAAYASTDHYTDSSVVGADSGWSDWDAAWETTAADFTKVSLTPGADDTQLNFAWYSEKGDSDATPVVHFGTDKDNLETFEGTAGDVDQSLTGDKLMNIIM